MAHGLYGVRAAISHEHVVDTSGHLLQGCMLLEFSNLDDPNGRMYVTHGLKADVHRLHGWIIPTSPWTSARPWRARISSHIQVHTGLRDGEVVLTLRAPELPARKTPLRYILGRMTWLVAPLSEVQTLRVRVTRVIQRHRQIRAGDA